MKEAIEAGVKEAIEADSGISLGRDRQFGHSYRRRQG